jgi:hypothetical protein
LAEPRFLEEAGVLRRRSGKGDWGLGVRNRSDASNIFLIATLAVLLFYSAAQVQAQRSAFAEAPMQFRTFPPDPVTEAFMGDHTWTIYATGEIDNDAGERLEALMKQNNIPPGSSIYLHSPGGERVWWSEAR